MTAPASDKQVRFLIALIESRDLRSSAKVAAATQGMSDDEYDEYRAQLCEKARSLTKQSASDWISALKELPKAKPFEHNTAVPAGRYAVEIDGKMRLIRVWRGTKNPNIVQVYEVRGTEKGTRLSRGDEVKALFAVADDPGAAAREFGHRTGKCSKCGKGLDVNLSRKLGVGPVCLKAWYSEDERKAMLDSARADLREAGLHPTEKFDRFAA